jgi:cell division protein FtsW (lipid II flippase)
MTASFFDPAALRTRLREQPSLDVPFLVVLLALLSYGLIMLFSAGYAVALYRRGDAYTYIRPQLLFAALGAAAMYAASLVDYHVWHKLAWPVMGLSLILLVVVLFMPEYNGCKRWIVLPGLGTLQPSEIAKFAVVLVFTYQGFKYVGVAGKQISQGMEIPMMYMYGIMPVCGIICAICVVIKIITLYKADISYFAPKNQALSRDDA